MADADPGAAMKLPSGGGALSGIGETFQPDEHTGTGNFSVPIPLLPGRRGAKPSLTLAYSTGNGSGPFGLGWDLAVPSVRRRVAKGVPRYDDAADTFVLSGAEDLVPVAGPAGGTAQARRYRPRTESAFARITHVTGDAGDYWEVRVGDGSTSYYGTPRPATPPAGWTDPATVVRPDGRIFGWLLSRTVDSCGNVVDYRYQADPAGTGQRYLSEVRYGDYDPGDGTGPAYLVSVRLSYAARPDPFSDRKPGFDLRTTLRATAVEVWVTAPVAQRVTTVGLTYADQLGTGPDSALSLLARITVTGHDGAATEQLPPISVEYTAWQPARRRFASLTGELPAAVPGRDGVDLVDLFGDGLPSLLRLDGTACYWRNRGDGSFAPARSLAFAPAGARLGGPTRTAAAVGAAQLLDIDGDGRTDLVRAEAVGTRVWPLAFGGDRAGFDPSGGALRAAPTFGLDDPETRLVDLTGDGTPDLLRGGATMAAAYNDGSGGFTDLMLLPHAPKVSLADPRIRLADMTGDGLTDIVLVRDGAVSYWPSLGYGRWGDPVTMAAAPRFGDPAGGRLTGYDPARLLLGDVTGDGAADLVYVGSDAVTVWLNRSGNGFAPPVVVPGTPRFGGGTTVRLADVSGSGVSGVLWTSDTSGRSRYAFLDLTGGVKPYLLQRIDNHRGQLTTIEYATSTRYAVADRAAGRPWRTTLPFPVHVVARTTVTDQVSAVSVGTEFAYHHGYWDGGDREFRGFGRVDRRDVRTDVVGGTASPPVEQRTWYDVGPVGPEHGDWFRLDLSGEYWSEDQPMVPGVDLDPLPTALPRRGLRDAVRSLQGRTLRSEVYAHDGTALAGRPYEVSEHAYTVRPVLDGRAGSDASWTGAPVVVCLPTVSRTTVWERGHDPMTRVQAHGGYDDYGRAGASVDLAVPRGRDPRTALAAVGGGTPPEPYLASLTTTTWATRDDATAYLTGCVAAQRQAEVLNDGTAAALTLARGAIAGSAPAALRGLLVHHYDGIAYQGLPAGQLGDRGLLTRSEQLAFTPEMMTAAPQPGGTAGLVAAMPPYIPASGVAPDPATWSGGYPAPWAAALPPLAGYLTHRADETADATYVAGYYVQSYRVAYDVQSGAGRGLVVGQRGPMGETTTVGYDRYALLPVTTTDPAGLTSTAQYDPRLLRPALLTDPNGNQTRAGYTPSGLLAWTAVLGKAGQELDTPETPTARYSYGLGAWDDSAVGSRVPVWSRTARRLRHRGDLVREADAARAAGGQPPLTAAEIAAMFPPDEETAHPDRFTVTVDYSDGLGRAVQSRVPADDVVVDDLGLTAVPGSAAGPATAHRAGSTDTTAAVVVSGWQRYDDKGRVIQTYEPYLDTGYGYAAPTAQRLAGLTSTRTTYDPRGLVVQVDRADGTRETHVPGVPLDVHHPESYTPTPWETYHYDAADNAARTHPTAPPEWRAFADTPSSTLVDPLGRTVRHTTRVTAALTGAGCRSVGMSYDLDGRVLTVTDELGRTASTGWYDLLGRRWTTATLDAGNTVTFLDASGAVLEQRDPKGAVALLGFDAARRPSRQWASDAAGQTPTLRSVTVYGDDAAGWGIDRAAAAAVNALGRPVRAYDEAGAAVMRRYDPEGRLVSSSRQVLRPDLLIAGLPPAGGDWSRTAYRVDWQPPGGGSAAGYAATLLDPTEYASDVSYDALGRRLTATGPADLHGARAVVGYGYGRGGALSSVQVDGVPYLRAAVHDARGQRVLAHFGNGVLARYVYDPLTLRLTRLRVEPATQPDPLTWTGTGGAAAVLQDVGYTHDLVGNLTAIADRTPGCGVPVSAGGSGPDTLDRQFGYDALSRLVRATGRETATTRSAPWQDTPAGVDITKAVGYVETYGYDDAGNLTSLAHASPAGYTRTYTMTPGSDRLATMTDGSTTFGYGYDAGGNLLTEATTRFFEWDHADRCVAFRTQTGTAAPSRYAQYRYDATGRRALRVVLDQGGTPVVTVWVDGVFERVIRTAGDGTPTRHDDVHVMDGGNRIAVVRRGTPLPADAFPDTVYHLSDHLGSSVAVLDATGALLNREEYTPYGETSFGSYAGKRFRFTAKERDGESGLYYHGARYYAPWLARWTACDPLYRTKPQRPYAYAAGNPMVMTDPSGAAEVQVATPPPAPPLEGPPPTELPAGELPGGGMSGANKPFGQWQDFNFEPMEGVGPEALEEGAAATSEAVGEQVATKAVAGEAAEVGAAEFLGGPLILILGAMLSMKGDNAAAYMKPAEPPRPLEVPGPVGEPMRMPGAPVGPRLEFPPFAEDVFKLPGSPFAPGAMIRDPHVNPPTPMEAANAREFGQAFHKMVKDVQEKGQYGDWVLWKQDEAMYGGGGRPDEIWINVKDRSFFIADIYTGGKRDVLTPTGWESDVHNRKGVDYSDSVFIHSLMEEGYSFRGYYPVTRPFWADPKHLH